LRTKRKIGLAVGGLVLIFVGAAFYAFLFPPLGTRATISFLGYTEHRGGKLAVFQLMNHTKANVAVLPGKFLLRTAAGMMVYTNEEPEIYGDIPPGLLPAQTSGTFAVPPPAVSNAWCLEMEMREFRPLRAWEVKVRQISRRVGLHFFQNKFYKLRTPELAPVSEQMPAAGTSQ
jgi:hypothetical protein